MKILISGAGGLIGRGLGQRLRALSHQCDALTRSSTFDDAPSWDPAAGRLNLRESYDAVIHLAGENVAGRWTETKKHRIYRSRVDGTALLSRGLTEMAPQPRVFLCASAVGYYGDRGEEHLTDESGPGEGFLAETAVAWESAADEARASGIRVAHLRFGVVLSREGGALAKLITPFRLGLGGRLGSGCQYWSWIALDDAINAIVHVLDNEGLAGPINLVAPHPVTNAEFTRVLAAVLGRPTLCPLPAKAVRLLFGRMGVEMLLSSARVKPARLMDSGFTFQHPELKGALVQLLRDNAERFKAE